VSATELYNVLGRRLGLDVRAVEVPAHVFAVVYADGRRVEVETTSRQGFNPNRKKSGGKSREVRDAGLVASIFSNRCAALGKQKRYEESLRAGLCACRLDPDLKVAQSNLVATLQHWSRELAGPGQVEDSVSLIRECRDALDKPAEADSLIREAYLCRLKVLQ